VDVRDESPETLIARYADGLEAVVVSGPETATGFAFERPDGSSIPLVISRRDRDDSVVARVAAVVRQDAVSSVSAGVHTPARAVANLHLSHRAPGRPEGGGEVVPRSPEAATNDDDARRDAKFAEQYARIRAEYCEFLEHELARNRAEFDTAFGELVESFDEKERYIDSLPSVRIKKWIVALLPNRES
jgi:hypothetical protein